MCDEIRKRLRAQGLSDAEIEEASKGTDKFIAAMKEAGQEEIDAIDAEIIRELRAEHTRTVIEDLMQLVEDLMPGVQHIALRDYGFLNTTTIKARQWLAAHPKPEDNKQ